jgi:hypothetical protein
LFGVGRAEIGPLQALELAVHTNLWRRSGGQMEVGSFHRHELVEQFG